jgi:hypothetical protein
LSSGEVDMGLGLSENFPLCFSRAQIILASNSSQNWQSVTWNKAKLGQ